MFKNDVCYFLTLKMIFKSTIRCEYLCNIRQQLSKCFSNTAIPKLTDLQNEIVVDNKTYVKDEWSNVTPRIISYVGKNLHLQKNNPLGLLKQRVVNFFYAYHKNARGNPIFSVYDNLNSVVTIQQNFDSLLVPEDHPSRTRGDSYYVNRNHLLRAHMTAHQSDLIKSGLDNFLMIGEVYRRDEIDSTHYPVFHQIDAVHLKSEFELYKNATGTEPSSNLKIFDKSGHNNTLDNYSKQPCHTLEAVKLMEHHLKSTLIELTNCLFNDHKIQHRWVDTYFPFTDPSWELEIYYKDRWIEVLGCGIMRDEILKNSGVNDKIGWAFGLGLERIAMCLYQIPDIRLFWSTDSGFLSQFENVDADRNVAYKSVSVYPQCCNDLSFWLPQNSAVKFSSNDFYDLVRSIGGDIVEQVKLIDEFKKGDRVSHCYRITYRHMERTLTQEEVNEVHKLIADTAVAKLDIVVR